MRARTRTRRCDFSSSRFLLNREFARSIRHRIDEVDALIASIFCGKDFGQRRPCGDTIGSKREEQRIYSRVLSPPSTCNLSARRYLFYLFIHLSVSSQAKDKPFRKNYELGGCSCSIYPLHVTMIHSVGAKTWRARITSKIIISSPLYTRNMRVAQDKLSHATAGS